MIKGRVFAVQRPAYYDKTKRGWVNKYDITPAEEHGEIIFLLNPGNIYRDKLAGAIRRLHEQLADFGRPGDHILAIGDPVAIAAAVMVASSKAHECISILKYDRIAKRYDPYSVDIT